MAKEMNIGEDHISIVVLPLQNDRNIENFLSTEFSFSIKFG